jgi:anti-sigma regulatory factor (Ser/Thr protein kinase)
MSAALGTARALHRPDFIYPELQSPQHHRGETRSGPAHDRRRRAITAASRVFAAQPLQVGHARRFVAGTLSGLGGAEDTVACVAELASNAVLHSTSRDPGGQFAVRVWVSEAGEVRAEVEDRGGPWAPSPEASEERGRGLVIVAALATRWGIAGGDAGRVAWLELDPAAPRPSAST